MPATREISIKLKHKVDALFEEKMSEEDMNRRLDALTNTGKPNTVYVRRSRLRGYLRKTYGYNYPTNPNDTKVYNEMLDAQREKSKELKVFPAETLRFLKTLPNTFANYVDTGRIGQGRPSLVQAAFILEMSKRLSYLLYVTGRRLDELVSGSLTRKGNHIEYVKSKVKGDGVEKDKFKPLVRVGIVMDLYNELQPFIQRQAVRAWDLRLFHFLRPHNIAVHDLRRIYAFECSKRDKRNVGELEKIKNCLNHQSIISSERYNVRVKADQTRCEVCDKTLRASSMRGHLKSKRHLENAAKANAKS